MSTFHTSLQSPQQQRLHRLAQLGKAQHYRSNTTLMLEGDSSQRVLVLLSGGLRVYKLGPQGRQFTLAQVMPVDVVGEMALDGQARSANVETTQASICVWIDRDKLLGFIAKEPEFAMDLLHRVIARARQATGKAADMALLDAYSRLTQWLEQHAGSEEPDGQRRLPAPHSQIELAQELGCSREMVSRLLKDLQGGGYLQLQGAVWVLPQPLPSRW